MNAANQENPAAPPVLIQGALLVLLGAFGFSAKAIFIKLAYRYGGSVDTVTLMALRMLMALPFFLLAGFFAGRHAQAQALSGRDWGAILILGFIGYYLSSWLDFSGLVYITAGLERLILYIYPTLVVLIVAALNKRRVQRREVAALLLTYAGVALVFFEGIGSAQSNALLGGALVLGAAVSFAVFTVASGSLIQRIGAIRFSAYSMSVAGVLTLIHYALTHPVQIPDLPVGVYQLGLLLAIFSTVIPSFMISLGIQRIGVSRASVISGGGPVATLALAAIVLGESISLIQIIGTVLVLTGVFSISRAR